MSGMTIPAKSISHVRLTVTDIDRSRRFYESVFGWPVAPEVPAGAAAATRAQFELLFRAVIYHIGHGLIGLRPLADDTLDENRAGLDHPSLAVAGKDEID